MNIQSVTPFHMGPPAIIDQYELSFILNSGKQSIYLAFHIRNPLHAMAFANYFNVNKASLSLSDIVSSYIGDLPESCILDAYFKSVQEDLNEAEYKLTDVEIQRYYDVFGRELKVNINKEIDFNERFVFYRKVPNGDESCGLDVCVVYSERLICHEEFVREEDRYAYCNIDTSSLVYSGWVSALPEHIGDTVEVKIDKQSLSVSCDEYPEAFLATLVRNEN
nr:hypothetical protein [Vibrio splendidus]MCC4883123.1 hypothetical protein [Vibrio splendidus]